MKKFMYALRIVLITITIFFIVYQISRLIMGREIAFSIVDRIDAPQIKIYLDEPIDVNLIDSLLNENLLDHTYNEFKQYHPFKKDCVATIYFYELPIERYSVNFSETPARIYSVDTIIKKATLEYEYNLYKKNGREFNIDSVWTPINAKDVGFFERRRIKKRLEDNLTKAIEKHRENAKKHK